ncbi:RidA family protein [Kineosporia sp. J2-2]|uniref:RidA family protein n=1 Tax=Kineosporia corallincola TaxID=2835133 RepID=A0ABS5TMN5_9ACTN|nr:RidA family protein [Kineosporia corallincola]MBT0772351.1 RidA family protein [Kineosporia corallincola]
MKVTIDNPAGAPAPAGPYSQVARIDFGTGAMLFVSGQVAIDEDGNAAFPGDMAAQSEALFVALGQLLEAHGATLADVVNIRTFLTDMNQRAEYARIRGKYLTEPLPTSTTVEVSRLFKDGAVIEIEVVAAVSSS